MQRPESGAKDESRNPMALTGRQIRQLRSLAHHLEPVITVGKQGVAPAVVDQANAALEAHELIKCSALENSGLSAREAADQLAELTRSEVVQVIGRRFSLYRETSREGVEKIQLD